VITSEVTKRDREGSWWRTVHARRASAVGPHRPDAKAQQPDLGVVVAIALFAPDHSDALAAAHARCQVTTCVRAVHQA
jgi:hypothetical protein